ncbi:TPA: YvcK family protein [Candidatus Avigastranaerophilus faecigallinarum]|nr:YvcK family protein [Candidatus Avigastranaerophilus faecigallinarum]
MKFNKLFIHIPRDAGWLLPGLEVKRWFLLIITGAILAAIGLCIIYNLRPVYSLINMIVKITQMLPSEIIGWLLIFLGAFLFFLGWLRTNYSILDVNNERNRHAVLEDLYRRRKLNRGPKIVAIGGGTGLSTMLKGIKKITNNITAVVTVGDDGGSSGKLREELGVLPPGDIRSCIAALADDEDLVAKLFQYRFKDCAGLSGHSFGNLFLTAMCSITGDMVRAVKESSKVLSIRGRVLPSTLDDMRLVAEMDDGSIIKGESNIPESGKKIKRLFSEPGNCKALEDVIWAIHDADLIILGPGSLYTSVIPNLLIKDIAKAVNDSKAKKIYVCNIMTQPGETDGFSVSDHIKTLIKHAKYDKIMDAVLVNNDLPIELLAPYKDAGSEPVIVDKDEINRMGIEIVQKNLIEDKRYEDGHSSFVRHSPSRLARIIYYWYRKKEKDKH